VDPSGQFVYVTNRGTVSSRGVPLVPATTISQYSIGATGALTPISPAAAAGTGTASIVVTN
jgi:hypothetical protein